MHIYIFILALFSIVLINNLVLILVFIACNILGRGVIWNTEGIRWKLLGGAFCFPRVMK